jgi:hypothetical protein
MRDGFDCIKDRVVGYLQLTVILILDRLRKE